METDLHDSGDLSKSHTDWLLELLGLDLKSSDFHPAFLVLLIQLNLLLGSCVGKLRIPSHKKSCCFLYRPYRHGPSEDHLNSSYAFAGESWVSRVATLRHPVKYLGHPNTKQLFLVLPEIQFDWMS